MASQSERHLHQPLSNHGRITAAGEQLPAADDVGCAFDVLSELRRVRSEVRELVRAEVQAVMQAEIQQIVSAALSESVDLAEVQAQESYTRHVNLAQVHARLDRE